MPRLLPLTLLAVVGVGAAQPLIAQTAFEATPLVGIYIPLGALVDEGPLDAPPLRKRHIGTLLIGFRSGARINPHVGVEASIAYTPSMVAVTDARSTVDRGAGVVLANLRAPFSITADSWVGPWQFHVAPGVGLVSRHGEVWSQYDGTTDVAAVLAFGARVGTPESVIHFRLEVEDYITWAQFTRETATRSLLHHDLLWSMGIGIPMGGR